MALILTALFAYQTIHMTYSGSLPTSTYRHVQQEHGYIAKSIFFEFQKATEERFSALNAELEESRSAQRDIRNLLAQVLIHVSIEL